MYFILFAIIAFIGWGSGDILGGLVSRKIKGYSASFWLFLFSFAISSLFVPMFWNELKNISLQMWLIILLLNLVGPIPMVALLEGIRVGNASLVGTISASFAAVTVILSVIFLGDNLLFSQIIPIIIIFIGLMMSSFDFKSLNIKNIIIDKGIPYGLVAMLSWGILYTFIRIPVREVGWFWPSYLSFLGIPVLLVYMKFKKIKLEKLPDSKMIIFSFFNAILLTIGGYSYNFAVMKGQTAIVAPIAGSYPILFVILSRLVFKDKLNRQQLIGVLMTVLGIVVLSILSV
ncbi:MAG: DMT family transporter [Candidatus Shapirobacteria bacterium]